jgi:hypothetical protein
MAGIDGFTDAILLGRQDGSEETRQDSRRDTWARYHDLLYR